MGRTVPTYRMHLESIVGSWTDYRRALRGKDRNLFDKIVLKARQHSSAASFCAHLDPVETALLSILLEMQRELDGLKEHISRHTPTSDSILGGESSGAGQALENL